MVKKIAFFLKVSGRVQGVGFRYSTQKAAIRIGIFGWVRNSSDGCVEVFCEGEEEKISKFCLWLKSGPPGSHVTDMIKEVVQYRGLYRSFSIEY